MTRRFTIDDARVFKAKLAFETRQGYPKHVKSPPNLARSEMSSNKQMGREERIKLRFVLNAALCDLRFVLTTPCDAKHIIKQQQIHRYPSQKITHDDVLPPNHVLKPSKQPKPKLRRPLLHSLVCSP
ncbi:hypothetical protein NC653_015231 [Populus alba x Populus x berolinensis]|uniref:Uncharacterized protein n=1 Tax=Populus alba x Populus x berolinensis TaxID=444605 RepID=A0AAD6VY77_9ROSI|nr:hypothetical protein NC653_015231 [Populus alba x Populus x berolinensis]